MCVKTQQHNNHLPVTEGNKLVFSRSNEWVVLQYLKLNWTVILKICTESVLWRPCLLQAAIVSSIVLHGDLNKESLQAAQL